MTTATRQVERRGCPDDQRSALAPIISCAGGRPVAPSKQMFRAVFTAIFCVLSAAGQTGELTADQIVQKQTEALGGLNQLKAIQNVKATGKASLMGGQLEAPVVMQAKRPTSVRMEMDIQGKSFVQAFDGSTSWTVNPFGPSAEPQKSNDED